MATDDRPLPLLPDQRPPKFPASLGACLTRNGEDTHLRILQRQFGDWTSKKPISLVSPRRSDKEKSLEPYRKKRDRRSLSESYQQMMLRSYQREHGETALETFRRVSKTVRIITSVCIALKSYIKKNESSEWSFIEMYLHVKKDMKDILVFNPYNFVHDQTHIQQISEKLKRALTVLPSLRTPLDILLILTFLRNIRCFKDYPPYTQIELCKCMILQNYESRRIVVKQGQPAVSFYIIKSGTLLINVTETNLNTGKRFYRSCAELKEGDCFGEVGLLERCNRTASVICKTDCQLLLILQDDFDRLIREPLLQQKQEHLDFCMKINLFQHFPCEIFSSHPNEFFYQYFPKDSIITNEAGEFKYLIVIMTGKCRLVSCIYLNKKKIYGEAEIIKERNSANGFKTRGDISSVLTQKLPIITRDRSHSIFKDTVTRDRSHSIFKDTVTRDRSHSVFKDTMLNKTSVRSGSVPNLASTLLKSKTFCHVYDKIEEEDAVDDYNDDDDDDGFQIQINGRHNSEELIKSVENKLNLSHYNRLLKTAAIRHRLRQSQAKEIASKEIYAQLAELTPGSVFGLESLVDRGRKGLKIISDGVECLFVSKRLFLQEANIQVLSVVNDMVMSFPSDAEITTKVKGHRSWYDYKQKIFKSSLKNSKYLCRQKTVI